MDNIKELYDLCETISKEIGEANEKIRKAGGKLTAGDADYVDKLTHTLKSIKTTIAMMEADDGSYDNGMGGYSRMGGSYRYPYIGGYGYRGNRGGYRNGYSRDEGMKEKLRELMDEAPDHMRQDIQWLIDKAA